MKNGVSPMMLSRSYFGFSIVAWKAFSRSVGTYRFSLLTEHLMYTETGSKCNTLND